MTLGWGERKVFLSYDDGFKVLKLPYKATDDGARYSMCVFLPHERDGLRAMVDALAAAGGSLLDHVPKSRSSVREVLLPKFKLSFFCSLVEELKGLGLADAFTEDADLSCLVDQRVCDVRLDEGFMFFFRDLLVLTNFVLSSVLHVIVYIVIHPCELRVKL
jgi:serine protease inhibitor